MKLYENEVGGNSVSLIRGDRLSDVPESHRWLISDEMRMAFSDPVRYFRRLAARGSFTQFSDWLNDLILEGDWSLELHNKFSDERFREVLSGIAGFEWRSSRIRGALIGLPVELDLSNLPDAIQEWYSLVNNVDWNGFCAGSLHGLTHRDCLATLNMDFYGADIDPEESFDFGSSPCADRLIYTNDGRGGWLELGSHQIHLLGTIADTINWVFSELRADRTPEWDHENWYRRR